MDLRTAHPSLVNAKMRRATMRWSAVARLVREAAGPNAGLKSPVIAELGRITGYSPAILVRQVALLEFLEKHALSKGFDPEPYLRGRFTVMEAAHALCRHDPVQGFELLERAADGYVGAEELRTTLKEALWSTKTKGSPDRNALAEERHDRARRTRAALEANGFPGLQSRQPDWAADLPEGRSGPPVCRFAWWQAEQGRLEGFDLLHLPTGTAERSVDDRIARCLVASAFFHRFWIVLVSGTPFERRVVDALTWHPDARIGIIVVADTATEGPLSIRFGKRVEPGPETEATRQLGRALETARKKAAGRGIG